MTDLARLLDEYDTEGALVGDDVFRAMYDAARVLLTLREAGALIITPGCLVHRAAAFGDHAHCQHPDASTATCRFVGDKALVERIRQAIGGAVFPIVDIVTEPSQFDEAVEEATAGVLDALRDAMPDGDS